MKTTIYKLTFCTIAIIVIAFNLITSANAASAGALDSTFDLDGKKAFTINVTFARISSSSEAVTVQSDGKILVVGGTDFNDAVVIRLNADGSFDTTFSDNGVAEGFPLSVETAVVLLNGKILCAGRSGGDFGLLRLNSNGSVDTTFGTNGIATIDFFGGLDGGTHLRILDDKIIVAGYASSGANRNAAVARFNFNGALDTTFSGDGKVDIDTSGSNNETEGIGILADGRILLATSSPINNGDFAIVRLTTAGNFDSTFNGGIVTTDFSGNDLPNSLRILPDGKFIVAGDSGSTATSNRHLALARYNASGSLDSTFGIGGKATISPNTSFSYRLSQMEIQENGKILLGYWGFEGGESAEFITGLALARLNSNGTRDFSFGGSGFSKTRIVLDGLEVTRSIKLLGNKVVVLAHGSSNWFSIGRFNLDIQPTQSGDFDGDGFTDIAVYRPSAGLWFIARSSDTTVQTVQFGVSGDIPMDADFDGDGKNDFAIYRPSLGQWWMLKSSDNSIFATTFGGAGDVASPGDYDKDGKTDITIFRPSTGEWLIARSSTGFTTFFGTTFGQNGDIPIGKKGL